MRRLAPVLLVLGCGGTEVRATSAPRPSVENLDAAPAIVDTAPVAVVPIADAGATMDDATSAPNPNAAHDLLLGQMAALTLKTIASPPRPPHPPPPPPPTHDLEVRRMPEPLIFESTLRISDGLPFEVVRRIIRQNSGRFRLCYEVELRQTPTLKAKIVVRFAIGRSGDVVLAEPATSTASPAFTACYVRAFQTLAFPQPETPLVVVEYGESFEP